MVDSRKYIAVINGPNLNRLGIRKPLFYGNQTLDNVTDELTVQALKFGFNVIRFQSNHEGELIDFIQSLSPNTLGIILNPGALMMSGFSLRDAIEDSPIPTIEVHISNIAARETFRHQSILTAVCRGVISGLGTLGYSLALQALDEISRNGGETDTMALPRKITTKSGLLMTSLPGDNVQATKSQRTKKTKSAKIPAKTKDHSKIGTPKTTFKKTRQS